MAWYDWLIVLVPLAFVLGMGVYASKQVKSVADFLVAGRLCGRYVISMGEVANALSIIGLLTYVEVHYRTGFALNFWYKITGPISILLALTGYCTYRFRETRAMSLGQFLEMRYSRKLRIFAAALRSISEMLANMIMPALAARFFIYYLDLPSKINLFGLQIPTFTFIVVFVLVMAISLICMGGTLAIVITDSIQGMFCYPLLVIFIIFIFIKFSWSTEIAPMMADRVTNQSFINPFDIKELRDFNIFLVILGIWRMFFHKASWIGAGYTSAARSPHEQKMASLLGTWRASLGNILYVLIAVAILTILNHEHFAKQGKKIRDEISTRVATELVEDKPTLTKLKSELVAIPPQYHKIGVDEPLSDTKNLDTIYLDTAKDILVQTSAEQYVAKAQKEHPDNEDILKNARIDGEGAGHHLFQQFRTLFHQITLATTMRNLLPPVLKGLFCLLMVLAMLSTDDSRIYSAALTITQDVVLPFCKQTLTPKRHITIIRIVSICIGVFFILGSSFMSQLDYLSLYSTLMTSFWLGGCGPMMIFGLYSKFGNTWGAWASIFSGMFLSLSSVLTQRNWANFVYPTLQKWGMVESVGNFLDTVSRPLNPYVVWQMNPTKCPINANEFFLLINFTTLVIYIVVSYATKKEDFNLDRMLHRGKYALQDNKPKAQPIRSVGALLRKIIGITPEYTTGDKAIAIGLFTQSFIYGFLGTFLLVLIWNKFTPWTIPMWSRYFFITHLLVPGLIACFATFWFGICGFLDLKRLFRDLKARTEVNDLDNGMVGANGVSLADQKALATANASASDPTSTATTGKPATDTQPPQK